MLAPTQDTTTQTTTNSCTPLMSWSQTPTTATIVVALRTSNTIYPSIAFTTDTLSLTIRVNNEPREYKVDAKWFAGVNVDKCTWKRLGNGDVLLTLHKAEEAEWTHPFADRAYKGFVRIDWSRWVDEGDSEEEGDGYDDLGALSQASPIDFGGQDESSFPSESNSEFQDLMKGLEKLGTDKDVAIPDMKTLHKMDTDQLKDMLKSSDDEGCSEVDLDKVDETVAVDEDVDDGGVDVDKEGNRVGDDANDDVDNGCDDGNVCKTDENDDENEV